MYDVVHSKIKGTDLKEMGAIKDLELSKRVKKMNRKREVLEKERKALEKEEKATAQTCSWCCSRSAAPAQTTGDLEIGRAGAK